jgi:hypothetical protein
MGIQPRKTVRILHPSQVSRCLSSGIPLPIPPKSQDSAIGKTRPQLGNFFLDFVPTDALRFLTRSGAPFSRDHPVGIRNSGPGDGKARKVLIRDRFIPGNGRRVGSTTKLDRRTRVDWHAPCIILPRHRTIVGGELRDRLPDDGSHYHEVPPTIRERPRIGPATPLVSRNTFLAAGVTKCTPARLVLGPILRGHTAISDGHELDRAINCRQLKRHRQTTAPHRFACKRRENA